MSDQIRKKIVIWLPFLVGLSVAAGVIIGTNFNPRYAHKQLFIEKANDVQANFGQIGRVEEIIRFIEHSYVDSINSESLTTHAINEILNQLDPFSNYISADNLTEYNNQLEGVFEGIGINYIKWHDSVYIVDILDESPASRNGLKRGDVVLSINGDTVSGKNIQIEIIRESILKGEDDLVKMTTISDGVIKDLILNIEEIELKTSKSAYLIDDKTVFVKIDRFSSNTYKQFVQSLENLIKPELEYDLIIDLRDNPGGYLPETIKILSQIFSEKRKLLTYTEGVRRARKDYESTGQHFFNFDKIAVLINGNSASGSEIIAGAVQDWDRGVIIGETSFGKGLVQEIHELKNGGAIRLTVARYMTPSGRSIQKEYVLQDTIMDLTGSKYSSKLLDRKLNGGGGIEPDIPVKSYNPYTQCGEIDVLAIQAYLLQKFPIHSPFIDFEDCMTSFSLSRNDFEDFNDFIVNEEDLEELPEACYEAFRYTASSLLLEYWYSELEVQMYLNKDNPMVKAAMDAFDRPNLQALLSEVN